MNDKIVFERKVMNLGTSKAVTLSNELLEWLGNPEEVLIMPEIGKHGKYVSIWNKKQKEMQK